MSTTVIRSCDVCLGDLGGGSFARFIFQSVEVRKASFDGYEYTFDFCNGCARQVYRDMQRMFKPRPDESRYKLFEEDS